MLLFFQEALLPCNTDKEQFLFSLSFLLLFQLLSHVQLLATPWTAACQVFLSLMSIESVMLSNHLILCLPLFLLPSIFPSIRVFSSDLALHIRWPKYWSFSFSISSFNEYSWLISFRMDWFDLLAIQGTLKSLLQYHSSKASILWHSAFFMVQLLHWKKSYLWLSGTLSAKYVSAS